MEFLSKNESAQTQTPVWAHCMLGEEHVMPVRQAPYSCPGNRLGNGDSWPKSNDGQLQLTVFTQWRKQFTTALKMPSLSTQHTCLDLCN